MIDPQLSLTLGDLTLVIDGRIISEDYPRLVIGASSERTAAGTDVDFGFAYEPPAIFVFTALLDIVDAELAMAIYLEQERRKRLQLDYSILTIDTTTRFPELAPRTRAIAPGTTAISLSPTYISYFAQWYCKMTQPPKAAQKGSKVAVTITMEERDHKVAP